MSDDFNPTEQPAQPVDLTGRHILEPEVSDATRNALESFQLAPPATIEQYTAPGLTDEAALSLDTDARHWLSAGEFPREVGSSLLSLINDHQSRSAAPLTDVQREIDARSTEANLQRLWKDDYQNNVALAQRLAHQIEAKRPGFLKYLGESGLGNNAMFISGFTHQAQMLEARGFLK